MIIGRGNREDSRQRENARREQWVASPQRIKEHIAHGRGGPNIQREPDIAFEMLVDTKETTGDEERHRLDQAVNR